MFLIANRLVNPMELQHCSLLAKVQYHHFSHYYSLEKDFLQPFRLKKSQFEPRPNSQQTIRFGPNDRESLKHSWRPSLRKQLLRPDIIFRPTNCMGIFLSSLFSESGQEQKIRVHSLFLFIIYNLII